MASPKADQDSAPASSKGSAKQCGPLDAGMPKDESQEHRGVPAPDPATVYAKWGLQVEDRERGRDLFVNMCQSEGIPEMNTGTCHIPAFVSHVVRNHVDIVVHPEVMQKSQQDPSFKEDLVGLALWLLGQHNHLRSCPPNPPHVLPPLLSVLRGEVPQEPHAAAAAASPPSDPSDVQ
eukprot:RCo049986